MTKNCILQTKYLILTCPSVDRNINCHKIMRDIAYLKQPPLFSAVYEIK